MAQCHLNKGNVARGRILSGSGVAELGLWPDPNPNPIGPGLLFFFTFWPAVICLGIGVFQVWRK
jgi:hypothetical protein